MSFLKKHLYRNRKSILNSFFKTSRRRKKSLSLKSEMQFVVALLLGVILAVGGTVFATSVGSNITVSGSLDVQSATATSTFAAGGINYGSGKFIIQQTSGRVGVSSTTPWGLSAVEMDATEPSFVVANTGSTTAAFYVGGVNQNGRVGVASSTPWGLLSIGMSNLVDPMFVVGNQGSTTAALYISGINQDGRIGIASNTPAQTLSVGGSIFIGASSGGGTVGGLGIGVATTTAGAFELTGNTLFGNAASDLVNFNSANLNFNNIGTSTLPINATAWSYATSTGGADTGGAFVRFDTTNTRVGISTSTPGNTFSVAGAIQTTGGFGVGSATTTPGAVEIASTTVIRGRLSLGGGTTGTTTLSIGSLGSTQGGCIELKTTSGGTVSLMATSSGFAMFAAGGC